MVKGVAKKRDKVAAKVARESAGTVVNWVMLLQNAVSLVEFNKCKMVINQVSSVAASTTRTLPSAPSITAASAKSQVRRIYEFDLTEDADDYWYEDGEYEILRLNEVDCEAHLREDVPRKESPAHGAESDEVHGFDVFARDGSLHDERSSLRVNMWDDPDGHVSEGTCADDDRSERSLDELRSTRSLWYDTKSTEEASNVESDFSCDEEFTPRLYCRAVIEELPCEPERVEVILDSGADCTVLPLSYQAVGHKDSYANKSILLDAQGNKIEGGESRVSVNFEIFVVYAEGQSLVSSPLEQEQLSYVHENFTPGGNRSAKRSRRCGPAAR